MNKKSIGIFDSGVGGLTVYKSIKKYFPHENIIYFGDTARVPYGPKSKQTIISYSVQNARFLLQQNIKLLIIACNTASAVSLPELRKVTNIPVIGVIIPGAEAALELTKTGRVGIIGTEGTINSHAYQNELKKRDNSLEIYSKSCPLFVPLVEEGWVDKKITKLIVKDYLEIFKDFNIDTLILGCTHYPVLKNVIYDFFDGKVNLVDSSKSILKYVEPYTNKEDKLDGKSSFYVSDNESNFKHIADMILEEPISSLEKVVLGESWFII